MMASIDSFSHLLSYWTKSIKHYRNMFALIGVYFVSKHLCKAVFRFYRIGYIHLWSKVRPLRIQDYGKWAVVTGGSDGIGKSFANRLAERGINLIIISRNKNKLNSVQQHICSKYNVEVSIVEADFGKGIDVYSMIAEQIRDKEIGILINNVGVVHDVPCEFLQLQQQKIWELINVNINSMLIMTHLILPQMVSRKRGIIINVSSLSAYFPLPLMSVFSASKAFVDNFSRGLNFEYKSHGIIIESLLPSNVKTSSFKDKPRCLLFSALVPDPETYTKSAINTIGFTNRTTGYLPHEFQFWVYSQLPEFFLFSGYYYLRSWSTSCTKFN